MAGQTRFYRTTSVWLRSWIAFILALALMGAIWYGCYWLVDKYAGSRIGYFKIGALIAMILGGTTLIFNEPIVVFSMGCKRIRKREQCLKLWDAVHGVMPWYARPTPRIYLTQEHSMNAFSFGWGLPFFSAVGATEGAVDRLTEEELSAVMAHEVGHVINKDILVSMAMTISVMMMAFTGWLLLRIGPYGGSGNRRSSGKESGGIAILVIMLVGLILYLFGRLLGIVLQLFVSRQREYAADATSAQLKGSSRPLISALRKIVDNPSVGSDITGAAFGFLCTADPEPSDMMSTHPNPEKRIRALERLEA